MLACISSLRVMNSLYDPSLWRSFATFSYTCGCGIRSKIHRIPTPHSRASSQVCRGEEQGLGTKGIVWRSRHAGSSPRAGVCYLLVRAAQLLVDPLEHRRCRLRLHCVDLGLETQARQLERRPAARGFCVFAEWGYPNARANGTMPQTTLRRIDEKKRKRERSKSLAGALSPPCPWATPRSPMT